jgi:hypothetical protein
LLCEHHEQTSTGFNVVLTPTASTVTLAAGSINVGVIF